MLKVALKIPVYWLFRRVGWPRRSPMNLTVSLTFRCNSRCQTCNVYTRKSPELSLEEWRKVFQSLGKSPFWVTISGGEPFLYQDIQELVTSLYDTCHPSIINIPTNGLLQERIPAIVRQIAHHCAKAQIVINLSIDDIEEKHDTIRGVPGNYRKALKTYAALKAIDAPNLTVGIHTVISRCNVQRIPQIYEHLRTLRPDSYVTEIAEERVELGTIGSGITPEYSDYAGAVDFLAERLRNDHFSRIGRITRAFRLQYYQMVKKILRGQRQVIPCYAGFSSAQIAPNGDVWMCCTKAESIGNLEEVNYEFSKVWTSKKARQLRQSIKNGECYCPLANASYTNMLCDFKTLLRAGWNFMEHREAGKH